MKKWSVMKIIIWKYVKKYERNESKNVNEEEMKWYNNKIMMK